jgi:hypothetical protein
MKATVMTRSEELKVLRDGFNNLLTKCIMYLEHGEEMNAADLFYLKKNMAHLESFLDEQ